MAWTEFRKTNTGTARKFNKKKGVWETGAWYVYERINGKRVSKPAGSLRATARKIKREVEDDRENGKYGNVKSPTLKTAYDEYEIEVKKTLKPKTWTAYSWSLDKLLKHFTETRICKTIPREEIIKFRAKVLKNHSVGGMINIMKYAKAFFNYCLEAGYIAINPVAGATKKYKENKPYKYLNNDEARDILALCAMSKFKQIRTEFALIVKFALLTGVREEEVSNVRCADIRNDFVAVIGKGRFEGKRRIVPISPKLAEILEEIKDVFPRGLNLFSGWSSGRIRQAWVRIIKKARIKNPSLGRVRFHDLRHTFASTFLEEGGDIMDLKRILGHESLATTDRYAHSETKHLAKATAHMKAGFLDLVPVEFREAK